MSAGSAGRRAARRAGGRTAAGLLLLALGVWRAPAAAEPAVPMPPAAGPAGAGAATVEGQLATAESLLEKGHAAEAVSAFRQANLAAGGSCGRCALGLARALSRSGAPRQVALAAARDAVTLLAGDSRRLGAAYCLLGEQLLRQDGGGFLAAETDGDSTAAEDAYQKAIQVDPSLRAEAWAGIAEARFQREKYPEARQAAETSRAASGGGKGLGLARSVLCRLKSGGTLQSKSFSLLPVESTASSAAPAAPGAPGATAAAGGGANGMGALRLGGAVQRPEKVYTPAPVYSEEARKTRTQGVVILESIIDRDGCVVSLHVLKGLPFELDRAALAAVEKWVFEPATLYGDPVKVYYTLTVNFQVQ